MKAVATVVALNRCALSVAPKQQAKDGSGRNAMRR